MNIRHFARSPFRSRITRFTTVGLATVVASLSLAHVIVSAADPTLQPRVMQWDLTYLGAFRLPAGTSAQTSFDYGGTALAYDPQRNGLMLVGHDWYQQVAEINIPTPSTNSTLGNLPTASVIQPFTDVLQGHINDVGGGTAKIGGLLPIGGQLVVSDYLYYDGNGTQSSSHFVTSQTFSGQQAPKGPFTVTNSLGLAGFVSGWMAAVPTEWQTLLGGPYVTGQCCLGVISRTSLGPSLTAFNPNDLGVKTPVPGTTLLGYPLTKATLGAWASNSTLYNGTASIEGMIFPGGTRSVLFFGRQGMGTFCYGAGTSNQSLVGTIVPDGGTDTYCYDPSDSSKGTHSFPYVHQVWAYDAGDLALVKSGAKKPWDILPYATWTMDLPFQTPARLTGGVTFDPATQRVFVVDQGIETANYAFRPIVHVFKLQAGSPVPYTPPSTVPTGGSTTGGSTGGTTGGSTGGSTGGTGSTGTTSPTPCSAPDPYTNVAGTTGICVNGSWVAVALINTTGTVRLTPNPGHPHVWALVDDHNGAKTFVPLVTVASAFQKDGLKVKFSGRLRPDVTSPISGTSTIELSSIAIR